ncbi:MAG TPA: sulfurtransferase, partial [Bacteroidales bacterium]|nr:sulfurtransferase [Bacteroidales bacterium]
WEKMYFAKYLGEPKVSETLGISDGLFGLFMVVAAIGMFAVAEWAEKKFPREEY